MSSANALSGLFGPPAVSAERPRDAFAGNPRYVHRALPGRDVYVRRAAMRTMASIALAHASEGDVREVSFICMGRAAVDAVGPYTIVDQLPLADVGQRTTVQIPVEARSRARARFPALDIVGWAHTHPGFGIFFSGPDLATCKDYGDSAVNFVLDPISGELGVALGSRMLLIDDVARYVGRAWRTGERNGREAAREGVVASSGHRRGARGARPQRRVRRRLWHVSLGLFLIGVLIALLTGSPVRCSEKPSRKRAS